MEIVKSKYTIESFIQQLEIAAKNEKCDKKFLQDILSLIEKAESINKVKYSYDLKSLIESTRAFISKEVVNYMNGNSPFTPTEIYTLNTSLDILLNLYADTV